MSTFNRVMVCVTQQKTCERLIKKAQSIVKNEDSELFIIHVVKNNCKFLDNNEEGEALEYLFNISKCVGADLTVLKSDNITSSLVEFAQDNKIDAIVMGAPDEDYTNNKFYKRLKSKLRSIEILVLPKT